MQPITKYQSFEHMEVLLNTGNDCIRMSVIYRPPTGCATGQPLSVFLEEFQTYIDGHTTTSGKLLLTGDFNFHFENESNKEAARFKQCLFGLDLQQHVTEATHEQGHCLDLVITHCNEYLVEDIQVCGGALSDHFPVMFHLSGKKPSAPRKTVQFRKMNEIDYDMMIKDINESDLINRPPEDLSQLVSLYNTTLTNIMEKYAPLQTREIVLRPHSPWFNQEIKAAKRTRRKLERKWRKSKLAIDLEMLRERHKHVTALINTAKTQYYCGKIEEGGSDQKILFQIANHLLHKKNGAALPTHTCDVDLADQFVNYFSQKVKNICQSFNSTKPLQDPPVSMSPKFDTFSMVTEAELSKVIMSGNSKSCRLDPLPTTILKCVLPALLPPLLNIVNKSLCTSTMPDELKCATVIPLVKKPSLDKEDLKHYRPVSNLPYVGKITEKMVVSGLESFFG
jgi:hypothetical protein